MIHKLYILIACPIFIFLFPIIVWSSNIQIDSSLKTINAPIDIIEMDFRSNFNDLIYLDINSYNFYQLPDSFVLLLDIDLLNQRLNSDYIFRSSISAQWRINQELTSYIKFNKDLTLKSDLGVFGKVMATPELLQR